jgi:hypothetical protein
LIRGHPGEVLDVLARMRSLRLPSVARLEFIPMKIGAGMTKYIFSGPKILVLQYSHSLLD